MGKPKTIMAAGPTGHLRISYIEGRRVLLTGRESKSEASGSGANSRTYAIALPTDGTRRQNDESASDASHHDSFHPSARQRQAERTTDERAERIGRTFPSGGRGRRAPDASCQ